MVTDVRTLPSRPSLEQYKKQAKDLVKAHQSGNDEAVRIVSTYYPRPLEGALRLADAQWVVARAYGFESWPKFTHHIEALNRENSPISKFELAADSIANGDVKTLKRLLKENPELIRERSTRVHRGTLLHYVGANGIEYYRQKTPKNALQILNVLLDAGAEVDAEAEMYGGGDKTLGLVATSVHPYLTGVQNALIERLLEAGAAIDPTNGGSTVNGCLANGRGNAAEFLAEHGARLDLEGAAGVGRLDLVQGYFNEDGSLKETTTPKKMRSGFAWACEFGRTDVAAFLLDRGMKVDDRLRHHGQTGLHWAAYGGHAETVKLLLSRNSPIDAKDEAFGGTPLGWALYSWSEAPKKARREPYYEVVSLLVAAGAKVDLGEHADAVRKDPRMFKALRLNKLSARERLENAPDPKVFPLEGAKAARFQASTMLIPSPMQVRDAIAAIPYGQTKTTTELRKQLARESGADVTCPRATTICWLLVAEAAEENDADVTPWWRLTKDGKPNPKLPGGAERHRALLLAEGVHI